MNSGIAGVLQGYCRGFAGVLQGRVQGGVQGGSELRWFKEFHRILEGSP